MRTEQNPYSGELAAMAYALRRTMPEIRRHSIALMTSNKAAALAVKATSPAVGSRIYTGIYDSVQELPGGWKRSKGPVASR